MARKQAPIIFITLITLISGLINLYSVAQPPPRTISPRWGRLFPLEFSRSPRLLTLLIGLALVVSAVNIYKRRRRAYQIVMALACASVLFHLFKDHHRWQSGFSLVLVGALFYARRSFTVKSRRPDWRLGAVRLAVAAVVAFGYGVAGFWMLEPREFGVNFNWFDSIHRTLLFLSLIGDPSLVPQTRYAGWFLDSLNVVTLVVIGYGLISLFRPMLYRFHTLPQERARAQELLAQYGRTSLDYFKLWPDKSFFFNSSNDCFIAYRVGANVAVTLGDPVGPTKRLRETIREFQQYCEENGWTLAWHQTLPDLLPVYRELGFKKLKIGDDAIVELTTFTLEGPEMRRLRQRCRQLEREGVHTRYYPTPLSDELIARLREVSDEWLQLPGRRERTFSLGRFAADYLRTTPVFTAEDREGRVLAFTNLISSYHAGEVTVDLMRHRSQSPNGIMDYLFIQLFLHCRQQGYTRFSLGMAPMAGFREREEASAAERAVHGFLRRLNFLFSFRGLKQYKAKFADHWEPRYVVYRNVLDLPKLGLALNRISELGHKRP
ncbi:MAG TPA: phosphatidylglycerol lysyltransferase domain-containing protein [Blastocatellia bacterium]|nr:phosphatidylglycerol lysyltransferase domain-containing protein [Blastocatellia bacterium]